ncbi:MAG: energy transducer TonB [Acidobacteria bacterium]|nr:energy transducer TonB [Acidobacteriota bacterium]
MPRDLFTDVRQPSAHVGTSSRYTVVLSMAAHVLATVTILAATILGPVVLPGLRTTDLVYAEIMLPPAPPPMLRPVDAPPPPPAMNPDAAPVVAPDTIAPEVERPIDPWPTTDLGPGLVTSVSSLDAISSEPPPPPPPVVQQPVRPGGKIRTPTKVVDAAPAYPAIAQTARVQGLVIIEATIDVDGRVMGARVLRSIPLLDEAALAAVRQWRYTPTLLNGTPVPVVMTVTVDFRLR